MPEATPVVPAAADVVAAVVAATTAAPPVVDPAKPAETVKAEPPDSMAPRFQALARETKRLAAEKQALGRERAEWQAAQRAKEEAVAARSKATEDLEKRLAAAKANPADFLRGVYGDDWYDRLTEVKLSGDKSTPDLAVQALREESKAELERIRKENEERWTKSETERKAAADAEKARAAAENDALVANFRQEVADFVGANAEKYEFIAATGSQPLVWQVIEQTAAKTTVMDEHGKILKPGRVLSPEEAAEAVEKHLEDTLGTVYSGKKWTARQAALSAKKDEPANGSAKTLTNAAGTGTSVPAVTQVQQDRYQRAAAEMERIERENLARAGK